MAADTAKAVPLTCHGHSRPVPHLTFSALTDDNQYYLISACKDNNPMLRDGVTGDWIGTFLGHKGAVWQARLSNDASLAVTGSGDFSAKIWNSTTGENLHTFSHSHIVRSVAFPPVSQPTTIATGGAEKKLRIFDIPTARNDTSLTNSDYPPKALSIDEATFFEVGPGVHGGTIKSIVWGPDPNILVTSADDKKIRWWDVRSRDVLGTYEVDGPIGTCELAVNGQPGAPGVLTVAAGKNVYFFGDVSRQLIKQTKLPYEVASAGLNIADGRFVTGSSSDTWVRLYDHSTDTELEVNKGHHGPVWTVSFSPDGKLYATGSEDGTIKLWKSTPTQYGLWQ